MPDELDWRNFIASVENLSARIEALEKFLDYPISEEPAPVLPGRRPATRGDALRAGYRFRGHGTCRFCGEDFEWWLSPRKEDGGNDKPIPINKPPSGTSTVARSMAPFVVHMATCPRKSK